MTDLQVQYRSTTALVPHANNARTHSKEQIKQLAASIRQFGFTNPILVDAEGGILAGHGRVLAAKTLGLAQVPTIALADLTPEQRRAYVIADNQLGAQRWLDAALLATELQALSALDFDLNILGFADRELQALLSSLNPNSADPEAAPPLPVHPVSVTGDLWLLGKHRILCGDATCSDDVARLLGNAKPELMVTDPPYGVDYDPAWRRRAGVNRSERMTPVRNDDRADWRAAWTLFAGAVAYVWHGALHTAEVAESLTSCSFDIRAQIIWGKPRLVLGRGHYHWQHEPCWYAVRQQMKAHWVGDRSQTTLWTIGHGDQDSTTSHSTQKPVECMRRPIENNSRLGDAVYDPFVGSGTTLIAAEQTRRSCLALEIDPRYVDVAVMRWQAYSGGVARHADNDESFTSTAKARA